MNKKYDQTDTERDQSRRLEQVEADRKKTRQDGMPGHGGGQHRAGDEPRRQHGGWATEEVRRAGQGDSARNGDPTEKLVDEP